jgi:hypothetical protein
MKARGFEARALRHIYNHELLQLEPYTWTALCEELGVSALHYWPFLVHLVDMGRLYVRPELKQKDRARPDLTFPRVIRMHDRSLFRLEKLEARELVELEDRGDVENIDELAAWWALSPSERERIELDRSAGEASESGSST